MRNEQNILLIADDATLMKIYGLATLENADLSKAKIAAAAIGLIAAPTATLFGVAVASFFDKNTNSALKIDQKKILGAIQQSLGIGANVAHLPLSEANSISLGMGELAKNNSFYISHPIKPNIFVPLQSYNKLLAKEKNNVFMELAAALGAKTICLETASYCTSEGKIETDFNVLEQVAMDIGINASFKKDGSIKGEYDSSFDKPKRTPLVPPHLQKWIDIDSDLSLMVTHRLNNGLRSHRISLQFNDSLEGAAKVAAKLTGTDKGASFKSSASKSVSSTWVFKVEYHSMDD